MENPINMDDLGVPLFLETPIWNPKMDWDDTTMIILIKIVTTLPKINM